jgi:hypothetical protein
MSGSGEQNHERRWFGGRKGRRSTGMSPVAPRARPEEEVVTKVNLVRVAQAESAVQPAATATVAVSWLLTTLVLGAWLVLR